MAAPFSIKALSPRMMRATKRFTLIRERASFFFVETGRIPMCAQMVHKTALRFMSVHFAGA